MSKAASKLSTGRSSELWPVLLLVIVMAVPTIGVLWFAGVAMRNQQLATRQRLMDAYRGHLENLQQQIQADWQQVVNQLNVAAESTNAQPLFLQALDLETVDSVVCYQDGQPTYPAIIDQLDAPRIDPRWDEAAELENRQTNYVAASEIYQAIAAETSDLRERVVATQAQARCRSLAKDAEGTRQTVTTLIRDDAVNRSQDAYVQSVIANLEMMMIDRFADQIDLQEAKQQLADRLHDYRSNSLGSAQRLFLMKQLHAIDPSLIDPRILAAEELAEDFVATYRVVPENLALQPSPIPDVWQASTPNRRLLLLLRTDRMSRQARSSAERTKLPKDVRFEIVPPTAVPSESELLTLPAGSMLPGWRLTLALDGDHPIDSVATEHNRVQLWTGLVVVLSSSVLCIVIARAFQRQLRLANLKNDLVGTVSHELKTPLSSMRLLVETLLSQDQLEPQTTREYLELISKENTRLSRLIENFLTFSQMEQDRRNFEFDSLLPSEIVDSAIEAAGPRLRESDCQLHVDVPEDLPMIDGDRDALVTVVLNLLDNAYKYSEGPRQISVAGRAEGGNVNLSVSDNGIGMPPSATRRVFQRFYQVDQRLARKQQGCGLGLSIVDYIVQAHSGSVSVTSRLGQGTTFIVSIPIASHDASKTEVQA